MEQEQDEFAGMGGSYVLDPVSGKRTLVQRTEPKPQETEEARPEQPVE